MGLQGGTARRERQHGPTRREGVREKGRICERQAYEDKEEKKKERQ